MAATPNEQNELREEITELRGFVQDYQPGKTVTIPDKIPFPDNLFIGLFGKTGCGKSSLINSLKYATVGRLRRAQWLEVASQEKAGGHTMFRKIANLTKSIFVIDNRGLDNPNTEQALTEIGAQLDGRRGYSEQVRWSGAEGEEDQVVETPGIDLKTGHQISCAVFVFSAIHDIGSSVAGLNEVVDYLHSHQGRYPVAVITHVDVAERKTVDILATVLRVSGVSDIYEVANITDEKTKLEEQYQLSLLTLIERCMTVGDETVVFKHYQRVEQQKKMEMRRLSEQAAREKQETTENDATPDVAPDASIQVQPQSPGPDVAPDASIQVQPQSPGNTQMSISLEEERRRVEQLKLEHEKRKLEMEFMEKEYKMKMELETQRHQMEMERHQINTREKQLQENERDRRYQEALRKAEADKQQELMRIMQANRSHNSPLVGCKLQ